MQVRAVTANRCFRAHHYQCPLGRLGTLNEEATTVTASESRQPHEGVKGVKVVKGARGQAAAEGQAGEATAKLRSGGSHPEDAAAPGGKGALP